MNNQPTPLIRVPESIQKFLAGEAFFKREDLSFTGSFKFRPVGYQMLLAKKAGKSAVVMPTSGNAGIAAAIIGKQLGIATHVFTHPEIDDAKRRAILREGGLLYVSHDSLKQANLLSSRENLPNLRPSVNDDAVTGYMSLGEELMQELPNCEAIFSFTTSGASLLGLAQYYEIHNFRLPEIHAVQSGKSTTIARAFDPEFSHEGETLAGKGGVSDTRRKDDVIDLIRRTHGYAWSISNSEILEAKALLEKESISTSSEGCASLAAAIKASRERNWQTIVIVLSGKNWNQS